MFKFNQRGKELSSSRGKLVAAQNDRVIEREGGSESTVYCICLGMLCHLSTVQIGNTWPDGRTLMPYIHKGLGLPKDNRVTEGINSDLILSTIKWPDCIVSEHFHYGGPGSHGPLECWVMKASITAGTSLELTETLVSGRSIRF